MKVSFLACTVTCALFLLAGCNVSQDPKVVDLNQVLDVAIATMDQMNAEQPDPAEELKAQYAELAALKKELNPQDPAAVTAYQEKTVAYNARVKAIEEGKADIAQRAVGSFVSRYSDNLNALPLLSGTHVTVLEMPDGALGGFDDANKDGAKDAAENTLFTLEIDSERSRLIATDTQHGYRRDGTYRGGGFITGMLIGSMMNRQSAAGITSARYANMQMSPKDYHSSAKATAKASARSSSRSGSFKGGK